MTRNSQESEILDSGDFDGRVLTLLGEIINKLDNQAQFFRKALYVPDDQGRPEDQEMDEGEYEEI